MTPATLRRVVRCMHRLMAAGHDRASAKRIAVAVVERATAEGRPEPRPRRQKSGALRAERSTLFLEQQHHGGHTR